jgi:hypothetical protein
LSKSLSDSFSLGNKLFLQFNELLNILHGTGLYPLNIECASNDELVSEQPL